MASKDPTEQVDVASLRNHLSSALHNTEEQTAKYHLREAYQKVIALEDDWE